MNQETLDRMIREEFLGLKENLRAWVEAAESEAEEVGELWEEKEPGQKIFDILFHTMLELERRRRYLKLEETEEERRADRLLWGDRKE